MSLPKSRHNWIVQRTLDSMVSDVSSTMVNLLDVSGMLSADELDGIGSVQSTFTPGNPGKDDAFWNSLTKNIRNLHAVISGHGRNVFFRREFKDLLGVTTFQIMATNGAHERVQKALSSASPSIQGMSTRSCQQALPFT